MKDEFTTSAEATASALDLEVRESDLCGKNRHNKGLFTNASIAAGALIGEYPGRRVTFSEFYGANEDQISSTETLYIHWLKPDACDPADKEAVLASIKGRIGIIGDPAGFLPRANHSLSAPNIKPDGKGSFHAIRDIAPGEELTWTYAPNLDDNFQTIQKPKVESSHAGRPSLGRSFRKAIDNIVGVLTGRAPQFSGSPSLISADTGPEITPEQ